MTRYFSLLIAVFVLQINANGQQRDSTPNIALDISQKLENLTESNGDIEIDDDYYLQQMDHFLRHPLNLNTASENDLSQLQLLTPLQVHSLLSYRNLFGHFLNIYELQAIPGWSIGLMEKIKPYITVAINEEAIAGLWSRFKKGHSSFVVRSDGSPQKSKGYIKDSSKSNYLGSPLKLLLRYKYAYKNNLQYGFTATKDAGEQFLSGSQKQGFDFYSAHFFARELGIVKAIALGDFAVNMGQGLIQWQSGLAAKKGADVLHIKRQEEVLRPYNSPGEINFHRGIGITLKRKLFETTLFASWRKIDGNYVYDSIKHFGYISSLQTSGYHRTQSEINGKGVEGQFTIGGNVCYTSNNLHLGFNGIAYRLQWPLVKKTELYNKYALTGTNWRNLSTDFSYTWQNIHIFGEVAVDENYSTAMLYGLLMSVDAHIDLSVVYRSIAKSYQSLYSNAFTESGYPNNERGLFIGMRISPGSQVKIDAYLDLYSFPWLKYRIDAPSHGNDFLVQVTYTPDKRIEVYSRFRIEKKPQNYNPDSLTLNPVSLHSRQDWRIEFRYKLSSTISLRTRVEMNWYDKKEPDAETGFLLYSDLGYKPRKKRYTATAGFQYFETDGYNSRFYTFQHDVSTSFSTPLSYGKGAVFYCMLKYEVLKFISLNARFSETNYPGKAAIGTGLDQIVGNRKTAFKLQVLFNL